MRIRSSFAVILYLLVLLSGFALSGCGGGGNAGADTSFVFTGTEAAPPGSATFNFVRGMTQLVVPEDTDQIRFHIFAGENGTGTLVQQELREFAPTIVINPVSPEGRSVVVTTLMLRNRTLREHKSPKPQTLV